MQFEPFGEWHDWGFGGDGYGVAFADSTDGIEGLFISGVPDGIGLAVVEYEGVEHGVAGRTKMYFFTVFFAAVNYSQVYEGSPRDGKRGIAEGVVYNFVSAHYAGRICPGLPVDLDTNYEHRVGIPNLC